MGRKQKLENRLNAYIKTTKDTSISVANRTIELLSDLDYRERKILNERYGLDDPTGIMGILTIKNYLKGFSTGFDKGVDAVYKALYKNLETNNDFLELRKNLTYFVQKPGEFEKEMIKKIGIK